MAETRYSTMTSHELNSLFREKNWNSLDENERLDACQELENRLAAERGSEPRTLVPEEMDGATYGYQQGNRIYMNQHVLRDNRFVSYDEETGKPVAAYEVRAAGWQTYDTVSHEDEHGAQYDRGDFQTRRSYFTSETDPDLYRIQRDEARAFDAGESRTRAAIAEQVGEDGEYDQDMLDYLEDVDRNSYENALARAQENYDDEHIDQTLDQYITGRENGFIQVDFYDVNREFMRRIWVPESAVSNVIWY